MIRVCKDHKLCESPLTIAKGLVRLGRPLVRGMVPRRASNANRSWSVLPAVLHIPSYVPAMDPISTQGRGETMSRPLLALLFLSLLVPAALGAGHVYNENFSVLTPNWATQADTDEYAQQLLVQAEKYRKEIAQEWLGAELPRGVGRTLINVRFTEARDAGLTWPDAGRHRTTLYLATTPERALGTTLKHEMCHVVLATRFPQTKRLPAWIEEGIASRYDDGERSGARRRLIDWWVDTSNWPGIASALHAQRISATDRVSYTVASSVVEVLLARGSKAKLLEFAQAARGDLSAALETHYQIRGLVALESKWKAWVTSSVAR